MTLEKLLERMYNWLITDGLNLAFWLFILLISWKLVKKVVKLMNRTLEKHNVDATIRTFLNGFVDIVLKIFVVLWFLQNVGVQLAGLTALVASGGVAIGLAIQGSLSNFAGGIVILLIRPFNVGDYIEANGHGGTVEKIGIFYTNLNTIDNKVILIPNGTLANGSIINYSMKELRRVDVTFSVGYDQDVLHVKRVLGNIIDSNELILREPEPFIALSAHGDSAINFVIRVWVKNADYWTVYFDMLEKAKIKFDEENISIPYPQMDLHLKSNGIKVEQQELA